MTLEEMFAERQARIEIADTAMNEDNSEIGAAAALLAGDLWRIGIEICERLNKICDLIDDVPRRVR